MANALYYPPADRSQWHGAGNATVAPTKVLSAVAGLGWRHPSPRSGAVTITDSASSPGWSAGRVGSSLRVSVPLGAMCLARIHRRLAIAPQIVHSVRHKFHVGRIAALTYLAEMVNGHADGNFPID